MKIKMIRKRQEQQQHIDNGNQVMTSTTADDDRDASNTKIDVATVFGKCHSSGVDCESPGSRTG